MDISVTHQANIFLFSIVGGMLIAFIYDIFRIKRKTIRTRTLGVVIDDFVFWILVALIMFAVVYFSNEGEVRGYIFIGTVIGVVLYALLLSRIIMKFFFVIIFVLKKIFGTIWFIISYPFKIMIKILRIPCGFMMKITRRTARKVKRTGKSQMARLYMLKRRIKNMIKKI